MKGDTMLKALLREYLFEQDRIKPRWQECARLREQMKRELEAATVVKSEPPKYTSARSPFSE
jgi:hypothetical protein